MFGRRKAPKQPTWQELNAKADANLAELRHLLEERHRRWVALQQAVENFNLSQQIAPALFYAIEREQQAKELGYDVEAAEWGAEREFYAGAMESLLATFGVRANPHAAV